ncbi:hypothetical protein OAV46_05285 [Euryarchaeota archaeon]|nr:hypothetical protein [Euryarchaeota archaeon]
METCKHEWNNEFSLWDILEIEYTLAMRYVSKGEPIQRVCTILGDTIATIETHYSERIFTAEDKMAFHRVNKNSRRESSEGTSQPNFLARDKSLLEPLTARGMDSKWWTLGRPPLRFEP